MRQTVNNISGITGKRGIEISLRLKDILIKNDDNNIEKLLDFLQEKVEGKYILNDLIDRGKLIKTCRQEILRKNEISIKTLDSKGRSELQIKMGEYLFDILPIDKQFEIIEAIGNSAGEEIHIKLEVNGIEDDDKLYYPWEYMRCSKEFVSKHLKDLSNAIWLSGKQALFYRIFNVENEACKSKPSITALLVDTTSEQRVYKFFNPLKGDLENLEKLEQFGSNTKNITFKTLGQTEGGSRAAFANLIEGVELDHPEIIHIIVDSFYLEKKKAYLEFFKPDSGDAVRERLEFSEDAVDDNFTFLISGEKRTSVFILQEWVNENQTQFEALENVALLLSRHKILSTLIIPYQRLTTEKDQFEAFYFNISNGDSIGNAVKKLRMSFVEKKSYSMPIFYLNSQDFSLIEMGIPLSNDHGKAGGKVIDTNADDLSRERMTNRINKLGKTINQLEKQTGTTQISLEIEVEELRQLISNDYNQNKEFFDHLYENNFLGMIGKYDDMFNKIFNNNSNIRESISKPVSGFKKNSNPSNDNSTIIDEGYNKMTKG